MSSSTETDKFPFSAEFGEDGRILNEGQSKFRRYTSTELEEAVEAARVEAIQSVEAETQRRLAASAEAMLAQLEPVLPHAVELATRLRREAAELALNLARQISGVALAQFPKEAVEASLKASTELLPQKVTLILKVAPELEPELGPLLDQMKSAQLDLQVEADPSAVPGAWSVSWDKGGLSHDPAELAEQLADIVQQYLVQPINPQGDLFTQVA